MTKEEFNKYLIGIGGLERTYREYKGPIIESGWVGEGWNDLLKNLIDELLQLGWDKRVNQIKEKFGGLRFYVENTPVNGHDVIDKYEKLSYSVCETCGNAGVLRAGKWLKTRCDEHSDGQPPINNEKTKFLFG
jgi:hypothetical protein